MAVFFLKVIWGWSQDLCCFLASILYIFLLGIIFTISLPYPPTVSTFITFTFLLSASKMIRKVLHHFCLRQTEVGRNNRIILTLRHTNRSNQSKCFCQLGSWSLYEELTTPNSDPVYIYQPASDFINGHWPNLEQSQYFIHIVVIGLEMMN